MSATSYFLEMAAYVFNSALSEIRISLFGFIVLVVAGIWAILYGVLECE